MLAALLGSIQARVTSLGGRHACARCHDHVRVAVIGTQVAARAGFGIDGIGGRRKHECGAARELLAAMASLAAQAVDFHGFGRVAAQELSARRCEDERMHAGSLKQAANKLSGSKRVKGVEHCCAARIQGIDVDFKLLDL